MHLDTTGLLQKIAQPIVTLNIYTIYISLCTQSGERALFWKPAVVKPRTYIFKNPYDHILILSRNAV